MSDRLIAHVEEGSEASEVDGVSGAGSCLFEFGEGASRGFNEVRVSEVLEELLLEENPILRPVGRSLVILEIESRSDPVKGGVLEVGNDEGDLGRVGGVGTRLDFEDEFALDEEFPRFGNFSGEGSRSSDLGLLGFLSVGDGGVVEGGIDRRGELSLKLVDELDEFLLLSLSLSKCLLLLIEVGPEAVGGDVMLVLLPSEGVGKPSRRVRFVLRAESRRGGVGGHVVVVGGLLISRRPVC